MRIKQLGTHPIKTGILFSLSILTLGEFLDGHFDHSDIVAPILLIIFFMNTFIFNSNEEVYNFNKPFGFQKNKAMFSIVVLGLFMSSILMDALMLPITFKLSIFKMGITLWSGVFLANSILEHRRTQKLSALIFSQVAFITLAFTFLQL